MSNMRFGVVTAYKEDRGFGFVKPDDDSAANVFVHINTSRDPAIDELRRGDRIRFTVTTDRQGRACVGEFEMVHRFGEAPVARAKPAAI